MSKRASVSTESASKRQNRGEQALRSSLEKSVRARSFDLAQVRSATFCTSRTIKTMHAWSSLWPCLREFLQNTIDHLQLFEPRSGLHPAVRLSAQPNLYCFMLGNEEICRISATADQVQIDQAFTFPLHPRALDTGVQDRTKASSTTAGGFGDGFKTAALALLTDKLKGSLQWTFEAAGRRIVWDFVGVNQEAVGTFSSGRVMAVNLTVLSGSELSGVRLRDNFMRQTITAPGAAAALAEAVSKLQIFWSAAVVARVKITRGDFICQAADEPVVRGTDKTPCPGVYIRGIWVCKPPIKGAVMSVSRIDVTGRDRNQVDRHELGAELEHLMRHCDRDQLKLLLKPLRDGGPKSWLVTGAFFQQLLAEASEGFRAHLREVVFGDDPLGIYSKGADSRDACTQWARSFLASHGTPVIALTTKASSLLFPPTTEYELKARCASLLRDEHGGRELHQPALAKCLQFLKIGRSAVRVCFSSELESCFQHESHVFVPLVPLTKELLLHVISLLMRTGVHSDKYSYLMQACCEQPTRALSLADLDQAVARAKAIESSAWQPFRNQPALKGSRLEVRRQVPPANVTMAASSERSKARGQPSGPRSVLKQLLKRQRHTASFSGSSIPAGKLEAEAVDLTDEDIHHAELTLTRIPQLSTRFGDGVYCATPVTAAIRAPLQRCAAIADRACELIVEAMPELRAPIDSSLRYGLECSASYSGYCAADHIILNLGSFIERSQEDTHALCCSMITTITHELAHQLNQDPGHGPTWRDTHDHLMEVCLPHAGKLK